MEIANARTFKPIGGLAYDPFYASSATRTEAEVDGNGRLDLAEASQLKNGSDGPAYIDQWNLRTRRRVGDPSTDRWPRSDLSPARHREAAGRGRGHRGIDPRRPDLKM